MKRYFSSEDDTPVETVKVKAIKRGNVTGKKGTFHFDPDGKDPLARSRTVPVEVALEAKAKGLVEYVNRGSVLTSGVTRGTPLDEAVENRRVTSVDTDGEELRNVQFFGASGSDTRDTTAFARDPSKFARTGVQAEEDSTALTEEEAEVTELDRAEGDRDDDDQDEDETVDQTSTITKDETLAQEGNAGGPDSPPSEDDETTDTTTGDAIDATGTDTGTSNQSTESTADNSAVVDATRDTAAPETAPRPRRSRAAATAG
jgi:hypothetical protein